MAAASWTIALSLVLVGAGGPTGRWLGQDGRDFVSTSTALEPNGFQDIHLLLAGLPAHRTIDKVEVKPAWGGVWSTDTKSSSWRGVLERRPGTTTADFFYESDRPEKPAPVQVKVYYQGGGSSSFAIRGGRSNPNLRIPGGMPQARWAGQNGEDLTSASSGVGPDGFQDAQIALTNLHAKDAVKSVIIDAGGGLRWFSGLNPDRVFNAELVRDSKDPALALLSLQPDRDLAGRRLQLTIAYSNGKSDALSVAAERTDPRLAMPGIPVPKVEFTEAITGRWLGQDRSRPESPGDVRIALAGLPAGRTLTAAVLSDSVCGLWSYRSNDQVKLDAGSYDRPLKLQRGGDPAKADLYLAPYRDETGATMTLRLLFEDGASLVTQFQGGACDPFAGLPKPDPTSVVAKPGDDLHDLVSRFGTVRLAGGTHRLSKALILEKPITLAGEPGAVLEFTQAANEAPWTTAVKIHRGSTTLKDFAIRFVGQVRWRYDVSYGPAVIGTTDNFDSRRNDPKQNLTLEGLDVTTPPATGTKDWEPAIRVMRLTNTQGGTIRGCTLRGGEIEFFGGPWSVVDNTYRGTPPGTFSSAVVAGHFVHDLFVRGNRIQPEASSGKTWRFLVVTNYGHAVRVEENTVEGVGPRDNDKIPSHNAPEIILTESYRINFEGRPAQISPDGRLVTVHKTYGEQPHTGHVVSVLAGPHAGQWRRITQQVSANTFLLDSPLPSDVSLVSIAVGFINMRVEGNTIDCRGGKRCSLIVLAGNHFGPLVRKNRLIGGGEPVRLVASASEAPMIWGWSRVPWLGGVVEENLFEDAVEGGLLGVEHNQYTKSNVGRTYMTVTLRNNVVRWSGPFLRQRVRAKEGPPLRGYTLGYPASLDPDELLVSTRGDRLETTATADAMAGIYVNSAVVNGRRVKKQGFQLPSATAGRATAAPARSN